MAPLVVSQATGNTPAVGGLFTGLTFFLVQRLPSRSTYKERIQANGGRVLKLEAQAEQVVADHFRNDCPPGSISYTFIDASIRDGALADPADHPAGPASGSVRHASSAAQGRSTSTRTAFTVEDDRVLWRWVERARADGGSVKGNDIYKQLERVNGRHTFQSWRDRYINKLMDRPPDGTNDTSREEDETPQSQKRKRGASATLHKEAASKYGRKKQTPYFSDLFMAEVDDAPLVPPKPKPKPVPVNPNAPIEVGSSDDDPASATGTVENGTEAEDTKDAVEDDSFNVAEHDTFMDFVDEVTAQAVPTSALKRTADRKLQQRSRGRHDIKVVDSTLKQIPSNVPTSDANRAAAQQLQREAQLEDGHGVGDATPHRWTSNVSRSKVNRAAEQQLPRKSLDNDEEQRVDDAAAQQPPSNVPTSEANRAAELQDLRESAEPASTVINGVKAEGKARVSGAASEEEHEITYLYQFLEDGSVEDGSPEQSTSEEADTDKVHDDDYYAEVNDITVSNHLLEDGSLEDGLPGGDAIEPDEGGALLMEANPASQQAEHRENILKGQDPEEDDLEKGQSDCLIYLQAPQEAGKIPKPAKANGAEAAPFERRTELVVEAECGPARNGSLDRTRVSQSQSQPVPEKKKKTQLDPARRQALSLREELLEKGTYTLSNDPRSSSNIHTTAPAFPDFPLSSQHDDQDPFESNLEWPSSPQEYKRQQVSQMLESSQKPDSQSQSLRFETQIPYPQLPSQDEDKEQADEDVFTTPPSEPAGVRYPGLPKQPDSQSVEKAQQRDEVEVVQPDEVKNADKSYVMASGERLPLGGDAVENDDDEDKEIDEDDGVDLTVPEPDGESGFYTSPIGAEARHAAQQLKQRAALSSQVIAAEIDDNVNDMPSSQHARNSANTIHTWSTESSSSPYVSSEPPSSWREQANRQLNTALETQDILNADTLQPDLAMPLPPDSDEDSDEDEVEDGFDVSSVKPVSLAAEPLLNRRPQSMISPAKPVGCTPAHPMPSSRPKSRRQPSLPASPSQPIHLSETQTLSDEGLEDYIATVSLRYKVDDGTIIWALKATSMRPELAELAVLEQKAGRGLPKDVPGVWTETEDTIIESGNARKMSAVVEKHGWPELEARLEFLAEWRAT